MRIKCIKNKLSQIPKDIREYYKNNIRQEVEENEIINYLELNKEYNVYGIMFYDYIPFFLIEDTESLPPSPICAAFFEIINPIFSRYWELTTYLPNSRISTSAILFKEWSKDEMFYENLLNEEERELKIYLKYKKLIDAENLINE